jgi:hypothetical protein
MTSSYWSVSSRRCLKKRRAALSDYLAARRHLQLREHEKVRKTAMVVPSLSTPCPRGLPLSFSDRQHVSHRPWANCNRFCAQHLPDVLNHTQRIQML